MAAMTMDDVAKVSAKAIDQFRLETLPQYLVPQEEAEFAAWKRGERTLDDPSSSSWLAHIHDTTAAGVHWWRVRIVDYPLTEYSKYELFGYQANAAAGEQIFVADRAWHQELHDLHSDFWIFDNSTVVRMIYDAEGRLIHPEQAKDSSNHLNVREVAMRHAIPLADYLRTREPSLIA